MTAPEADRDLWHKRTPLSQHDGEEFYADVALTEDGSGVIQLGSDRPALESNWTTDPAPITTRNQANDLAHALQELADKLP